MQEIGTLSWGVKLPYLKAGDDLVKAVIESVVNSYDELDLEIDDCDVIAITESLLARTQNNFVSSEDISRAVKEKFGDSEIAVTFPILSRNRVATQLLAIAGGVKKVYLQLSFPQDEVGNPLITNEVMWQSKLDYNGIYSVKEFRALIKGTTIMPLTGVDYLDVYENLTDNIEIVLANDVEAILSYTKKILIAGVHRRELDRKILSNSAAELVYDLSDLLNKPTKSHGYNSKYGLYGSNKTGDKIKLFPRDGQDILKEIQLKIKEISGKQVEVMVYADGAFKDPQYGIWELYDPCVAPFFSSGLQGSPNEMKLKDLIESGLSPLEIQSLIADNPFQQGAMGTTPRRYTDLLGSLCDLTSGSGDKATPVVVIKNYFNKEKCREILGKASEILEG